MATFYLYRKHSDYSDNFPMVIEDIYASPDYMSGEPRFLKLMDYGKEVFSIRLSQFRCATENMLSNSSEQTPTSREVDRLLLKVGRNIFQSAWHDDQNLGMAMSDLPGFRISHFREAAELLYLTLTADLCDLRGAVDEDIRRFFHEVYPHKPIYSFITQTLDQDGNQLMLLPKRTKNLKQLLAKAFLNYLQTPVSWAEGGREEPLFKRVLGNYFRLDMVADNIVQSEQLCKRRDRLEKVSQHVIESILLKP